DRFSARDVANRLPRNGVRKDADEVTRMPGLEYHAEFAVRFEAANTVSVSGARIDDNKTPQLRVDFDSISRDDARKGIIDRSIQSATVLHKLYFISETSPDRLRHVFALLGTALTHDVQKQTSPLEGIDCVFHRRREAAARRHVKLR